MPLISRRSLQVTLVSVFLFLALMVFSSSPHRAYMSSGQVESAPVQPGFMGKPSPSETQTRLNPAAWGGNHAGKPVPDYVHGDECLFCHRNDIGPGWQKNSHGITLRQGEDAPELRQLVESEPALKPVVPQIEYFLGSRHRIRFLKKAGYGKFAMLSTQAVLGPDRRVAKWIDLANPSWDPARFANRCAGCHATGVDS